MGQATSSPTAAASTPSQPAPEANRRRRSTLWRRSLIPFAEDQDQDQDQVQARQSRPRRPRSVSINRLSQLLQSSTSYHDSDDGFGEDDHDEGVTLRRPSRLQRARTSVHTSISNLSSLSFRRTPPSTPYRTEDMSRPSLQTRAATDGLDFTLPAVSVADALDLNFDDLTTTVSAGRAVSPHTPPRRGSLRLPPGLSERLPFRHDRSQRSFPRRRPSPLGAAGGGARAGSPRERGDGASGEDNTALLSRLLSVAAAATAATLLDGNQQAIADARSVAGDGDDGSFNSFLQSLESGRLAAALRGAGQNQDENGSPTSPTHAPLNFFRMFRFGTPPPATGSSSNSNSGGGGETDGTGTGAGSGRLGPSDGTRTNATSSPTPATSQDGRMVPIIIVGIRSVHPSSANNTDDNGMPPFLDALSALPTTPFGDNPVDHDSIDNILGNPRNGTHFTHRRRASMGGVNSIASSYDAQRHHRAPEASVRRPMSNNNNNTNNHHHYHHNNESVTPPATRNPSAIPSSPSLSRLNSAASIPRSPTSRPGSIRSTSRRESIIRTTTTTTLETTTEDAPLRPRAPRARRLSESDYRSTFASRRNGIVEPDHPTPPSENTRSWIIYVLGGSYPENHPILTTPSLFTDSPTYEDMMLLSALLGPAKPPVASEQDVASAGGIFKIEVTPMSDHGATLVAVAVDQSERVELVDEQRCLVCLCDFEAGEEARQLTKCKHLFHKECIDEWLTKGRNSCPLCRGQGVDEKEKTPPTAEPTSNGNTNPSEASSSSASFVDAPSTTALPHIV